MIGYSVFKVQEASSEGKKTQASKPQGEHYILPVVPMPGQIVPRWAFSSRHGPIAGIHWELKDDGLLVNDCWDASLC